MKGNISIQLNEEQLDAVEFKGKHLLVLAGAGTGKTQTIISRAKYLIDHGVTPSRILILSFTRKSAQEIVERIKAMSFNKSGVSNLVGRTFHSWCMDIIKNNPDIFQQHNYTVIDREDQEGAFKFISGKNYKDDDNRRITPQLLIDVYSYSINTKCSLTESIRVKAYDNQNSKEVYETIEKNKDFYADMIKKYLLYKKERNYIDYDDILNIVAKGLKKNKEAQKFIASKQDYILIDEMQDTNPLQYELLSSFYEYCSLFCVGDDAQSIYGFRGADFKTMHNFVNIVPDSEVKKLTLNYRSTQEILNLSNWLLNQSPLKYGKDLKAYRGVSGFLPQIINVDNDWIEANDITDKILSSIAEKGFNYNDNMVLSRTLWGLRKVEACCLEKKIPYTVFGGSGLMKSKHVRDLVSALRIVSNIQDELAWMRYLMLWKGVGEVTAARIVEKVIFSQSMNEVLDILSGLNLQLEISTTLKNITDLQSYPSKSIHEAYKTMEKRLSEIYKDEWEWRKQDFDILQEVALSTSSITEFVAEYVLDPKLETTNKIAGKDDDDVTLTTIHSAKGLEAKICYVVNVSPYGYPTPRAILNGSDSIEEERRCLYVAFTRAKDELYIYRNIYSNHVEQPQSKYTGAIVIGSIFVEKDNHENQILITYIQEKEGYDYIGFRPFNYDGPYGDLLEFSFRKLYIPLSEINNKENIQQDDYYFLNNVPENLIQNSYKNMSSKDINAVKYSGDQIKNDDIDEFDFN